MAGGARRMLADLTNRPEALAARPAKAPPAKAAAAAHHPTAAEAPQPKEPQVEQQLDECDALLRSFRQLGVDAPAAAAEDNDNQPLEAEDSGTSTATAGSTQLGFSSAKEAGWSSPLAAFAAAKERLVRNTLDADSLLARLGSTRPPAPDAATPRAPAPGSQQPAASTARSSLLARLPLVTAAAAQRGNLLPQHQRQHVLLLRERLTATMQLCQVLHTQNQANLSKVAQLVADNQHLSRSLHEARLDKETLQATIRALTREAAMLAEQAQRALLPAGQPAVPLPAAGLPPRPASAPAAVQAATAEPEGLSLVRDWSQALSEAGSCGGRCSSARLPGAAWQPSTSVRSFAWEDVPEAAHSSATTYVQGGDASGAACDKRRRLTPGMLAHCLRPAIRDAVAAAAAMEAASSSGRVPTPGRTPKRKLRQLSSSSMAAVDSAAVADPAAAPAAAVEAAAGVPGKQAAVGAPTAAAAPASAAESVDFRTFELFESRWHGAAQAPAAGVHRQRASTCRIM